MAEKVQIEIEAIDAASGILRGIVGQFGEFGRVGEELANVFSTNAAASDLYTRALDDTSISIEEVDAAQEKASAATARFAEQIAVMVIKLGKEAVEATVKYNSEIHNLSLMSGESMEASSRLVQVLDDFKIGTDQLTPIIKTMTAQGLAPNIETMAELSDQYLAIQDPVERNAFLFKNFGRAGDDLALAMNAGGDAIREMGNAVDESLIATEKGYIETRKYEVAVDQLGEKFEGLKLTVGGILITPLTNAIGLLSKQIEDATSSTGAFLANMIPLVGIYNLVTNQTELNAEAVEELAKQQEDAAAATDGLGESANKTAAELKAEAEAAQIATEANNSLLGLTMSLQGEIDSYTESMATLTQQQTDLNAQIADAIVKYGANSDEVAELTAKQAENGQAIEELANKYNDAMTRIAYDLFVAKLKAGEFTDAEYNMAIQAGVSLGIIDQKTADIAVSMNNLASSSPDAATFAAGVPGILETAGAITTQNSKMDETVGKVDNVNSAFADKTQIDGWGNAIVTAGDTGKLKVDEVQNSLQSFTTEHARDELVNLNSSLNNISQSNPMNILQGSMDNFSTYDAILEVGAFQTALNNLPDTIDVTINQIYTDNGGADVALAPYGLPYTGGAADMQQQASNTGTTTQIINIYGGTIMLGESTDVGVSR